MRKGFSLVELLVVISIIAVLTAVTLPNFLGAREKARDSQRIQDLSSMKSALRIYYNEKQAYPTGTNTQLDNTFSSYFPAITNIGYTYSYSQTNNGDGFVLCVNTEARNLEGGFSQSKCGVINAIPSGMPATSCGVTIGGGTTTTSSYFVCAN